jgi:flagellin
MSNLVVQTNVLALNSHRNLKVIGAQQFKASARLSSGYRINSAADDAAGLAISEKMRAQIRGLDMASKNTQDGISLIQTAEGGMQEINNMIQRIRELVVQAANDTNDFTTMDRQKIQDEINQLTEGIDQMSEQVEFNAKTLLNGSLMSTALAAELKAEVNARITIAVGGPVTALSDAIDNVISGSGTIGAMVSGALATAVTVSEFERTVLDITDDGANTTSSIDIVMVAISGTMNTLDVSDLASRSALRDYIADLTALRGELVGATLTPGFSDDLDTEIGQLTEAIQNANAIYTALQVVNANINAVVAIGDGNGDGLWFQTGSNSGQGMNVGIGRINTDVLGIGNGSGFSSVATNQEEGFIISGYIDIVNDALNYVTSQRAKLGAIQNRLEFTKSSLEISSENLSAAESRIRDADMAKEMMRLTAANILQQAGVSMLAQANQSPQSVLQLLG